MKFEYFDRLTGERMPESSRLMLIYARRMPGMTPRGNYMVSLWPSPTVYCKDPKLCSS